MTIAITRDSTIGDIVKKYPSTIEILQEAGVHCVGCHVAYHETLEQGFRAHGMSEEHIDTLISEMKKAASQAKDEQGKDLIITQKAASKLHSVLVEHNKQGSALRVSIVPGGCSGFEYGMELDEQIKDDDKVFEEKNVKVVISQEHFDKLKGSKIDFVDSLQGGGFKITNPNVTSSCGCGQSFA